MKRNKTRTSGPLWHSQQAVERIYNKVHSMGLGLDALAFMLGYSSWHKLGGNTRKRLERILGRNRYRSLVRSSLRLRIEPKK